MERELAVQKNCASDVMDAESKKQLCFGQGRAGAMEGNDIWIVTEKIILLIEKECLALGCWTSDWTCFWINVTTQASIRFSAVLL